MLWFLTAKISNKLKVNLKIIGLAFIFLILIAEIFIFKDRLFYKESVLPKDQQGKIEVFSLAASISSVDSANNFIMVRNPVEDKDVRVIISDDSEIVRFEFPTGGINSTEDQIFSPKMVKISINDLKPGDQVFIESRENVYKRSEFDGIKRIQVMP
jgi:hypothetical protein